MGLQFWRKTKDTSTPGNPEAVAVTEETPLPVTPLLADDDPALRVQIDQEFPAGWMAKDDGPSVAGTRTYTTSADMTTAASVGPAPTAGQYSVLREIVVSVSAATKVTLQSQTTPGAERVALQFPARGTYAYVPRHPIKLPIADKAWQAITADVVTIDVSTVTTSEA